LRVAGMGLDLEPDAEPVLRLPDARHFRARIAGDHARPKVVHAWKSAAKNAANRAAVNLSVALPLPVHRVPSQSAGKLRLSGQKMTGSPLQHLFSPLTIRGKTIKNRILSTGHDTTIPTDSLPNERLAAYHQARAEGGAGLIIVQVAGVH